MHHLGTTRSAYERDHSLQTPETFVRAPLPGMVKGTAIVHVSPARGAKFVQYTAELEADGRLGPSVDQRFIYVLDGAIACAGRPLAAGDFAYAPAGDSTTVQATSGARLAVFEKPYQVLEGTAPAAAFGGRERDVEATALNGDEGLQVRALVPDTKAIDFRVNTMTYQPGATLSAIECHVMEHGLLMLEGGGIYRLGATWYPVSAGDFIWMAPYCPQWFGALGKTPAKYLIYKDWDRHPR